MSQRKQKNTLETNKVYLVKTEALCDAYSRACDVPSFRSQSIFLSSFLKMNPKRKGRKMTTSTSGNWKNQPALEERAQRIESERFEPRNYCFSYPRNKKTKIEYMQILRSPSIMFLLGLVAGLAIMELLR
jgi:hypothetical protein